MFDTQRLRASPVWLLYIFRVIVIWVELASAGSLARPDCRRSSSHRGRSRQLFLEAAPPSNFAAVLPQHMFEVWVTVLLQVNKKFRKFERKYRDCIKRNGDKIGTQTCYDIST